MEAKKIFVISFLLLFFSQTEIKAQKKWHLWHTYKGVSLYYAYTPESEYGDYAYYSVKVVNNSPREMSLYGKFDFVNEANQLVTDYEPWNVTLQSGRYYIHDTHYTITDDLRRRAGNVKFHYSRLWIR